MTRLWKTGVLLLAGLMAILPSGCSPWTDQPVRHLQFSLVTNIDHSTYKGAVRFADLVKERTHGRLIVTVHPNSQLAGGSLIKEVEMLREGKIDFSFTSNLIYTNFDRRFFACSVPWLFSGDKAADRFLTGPVGREVLDMARDYGIEGLAFGENGFRQITNSARAVRGPDDMRGLRIRVPSAMYEPIYRALGAEPVVMTWTPVYKALQEHTLDGQENPVEVIASFRLYEVQKYVTMWNYSYDAYILGINRKLYESFDKETQGIVREAAREAAAYQTTLSRESARANLEAMRRQGMEITEPTPEQVGAFRARMQPAYAEYEPVLGKGLLDSLRNIDK